MDDFTRVNPTAEIMCALQKCYLESTPYLTPKATIHFLSRFFEEVDLQYAPDFFADQKILTISDCLEDQTATMWAYQTGGHWSSINEAENLTDWYADADIPPFMRVFIPLHWVPVGTHTAKYRTE